MIYKSEKNLRADTGIGVAERAQLAAALAPQFD
jgi:hypothetical protein